MAFDLSTAKPASGSGFDLSTAKPQEESFAGAGFIEPVRAIASGAGRAIVGGIAGVAQTLNPLAEQGAGAAAVEEIQEGAFQPETQAGKESLKSLGELVQKGVDLANIPISGLAGILELVTGQGIDQAAETIKGIQSEGLSATAGERVLEETGSPLAATIAATAPTAIGELIGLKGAGAAIKGTERSRAATLQGIETAVQKGKEIVPVAGEAAKGVFQFQTPTKQRIAKLIGEGSTDVETAKFEIKPGTAAPKTERTGLQKLLDIGGAKVQADVEATGAIKQGFDEGVIAAVKGASQTDKTKMAKMVDIMERGKKNARFAALNRPSDVAGDSLMQRFRAVRTANRTAGSQLDGVAKSLKGQNVDSSPAVNTFIANLDEIGVRLGPDNKPLFDGSDIEGVAGAERVINQIVKRMRDTKTPDGHDVHRLKRFIDEQVTFGKTVEGLSGRTESILKSLRRDLDGILDKQFPEYDKVNTVYSETIGAIDALQDVAGKKLDLTAPNADKATGTLLRRLMSNAQSRVRLLDSIDEIEGVARKHGGFGKELIEGPTSGKDDLLTQILFVDELDSVFGPAARTSLAGELGKEIKRGAGVARGGLFEAGVEVAGKVAEKARGINEQAAFKSIKELLKKGVK